MSEKLLPCPFCGGEAVIRVDATRPAAYRDRLRVGCETAGCRGFYHAAWVYYETPEQAAEAWNTRAELTAKPTKDKLGFAYCGECGWNVGAATAPFSYCSHCGRKVKV